MDGHGSEHVMLGPSSAHEAGKDFTDARGRRWLAAQRINPQEVDVAQTEKERRTPDDRAASALDPRTLSREDLAQSLSCCVRGDSLENSSTGSTNPITRSRTRSLR